MTREDTLKILMTMQAAYPNYKPIDKSATVNAWTALLSDYSYEQVAMALKAYIQTDTSGFAPAIGQVIAQIQILTQPEELNEMEAWSLVSNALRNGYYGAEKEFEKLPPTVQEAVGTPDNLRNWSQSSLDSIETVVQSNFLRTYRAVVNRKRSYNRVSGDVRVLIDTVNEWHDKRFQIEHRAHEHLPVMDEGIPMPEGMREKLEGMLQEDR